MNKYYVDKCVSCNTYQLGAYFCLNHCGTEVKTVFCSKELRDKVYASNKPIKGIK